jgi:hypothetical protein
MPKEEATQPSLKIRKDNCLQYLRSLPRTQDGELYFCIGQKPVCKSFFKEALGIPEKSFNTYVAFVTEKTSNKGTAVLAERSDFEVVCQREKKKMKPAEEFTLAFFDSYFLCKCIIFLICE